MPILPTTDAKTVQQEVAARFTELVSAINAKDADAWAEFYSQEGFLSAVAGTDCYATRNAWVGIISRYFCLRETQRLDPFDVRVTPLDLDLALLTSQEWTEMKLKDGKGKASKHVFTMLWRKEAGAWKVFYSHESWLDLEDPAR